MNSELDLQEMANVLLPFFKASTLPSFCFTSREWYEKEINNIFLQEWLCVGREEQVPKPGDFFRFDIVGEPLIIARDRSGVLHAHSAVCRHRAALMMGEGRQGNCRTLVCPYHSWTYALSGELLATPGSRNPMEKTEGFNRADYGLISHRLEIWNGFIFVNFNRSTAPLTEWLGDLPEQLKNYKLNQMRLHRKFEWDIECNWKVYYENSAENYHTITVHYKNLKGSIPEPSRFPKSKGPYTSFFLPRAISMLGGFPPIEGLPEDKASGTWFLLIQPNLELILTSTYMVFRHFLPLGSERVKVIHNWCFPESTITRQDFVDLVESEYYDRYKPVTKEDVDLTPMVQKGLRSRFAKPGRFAEEEVAIHEFENYVLRRVTGGGTSCSST